MTRTITSDADDKVKDALTVIADPKANPTQYSNAMYALGQGIGRSLASKINLTESVSLACTNEDADYLTKGIIEVLESQGCNIALTCFWNERQKMADGLPDIAPIIKRYQEPNALKATTLIVVKSIIATACVVKTNLTNMIHEGQFERVFVVAPVIYNQAIPKLKQEFSEDISKRFEYVYFAEDSDMNPAGEVVPGIGGNLYVRLGFKDQQDKNKYQPNLVKQRRAMFINAP
ncbi:MAG: hypothetical protein HOO93_17125 [Methyloglobulus sp.]|nr:hypothetical protein [Methyloglobulus sp.]